MRTLGPPSVSVGAAAGSRSAVRITVAWELSWYQFTVDLSDPREPVQVRAQGQELSELDEAARDWNIEADAEGRLAPPATDAEDIEPVAAGSASAKSGGEEPA
jgi:hypothetical protein